MGLGFVCFGPEARVRGQQAVAGIGAGLDLALGSRGVGTSLRPEVLRIAVDRFDVPRVRAAAAAFNDRSLRLCAAAGFRRVWQFDGPDGCRFVELERPAPRTAVSGVRGTG